MEGLCPADPKTPPTANLDCRDPPGLKSKGTPLLQPEGPFPPAGTPKSSSCPVHVDTDPLRTQPLEPAARCPNPTTFPHLPPRGFSSLQNPQKSLKTPIPAQKAANIKIKEPRGVAVSMPRELSPVQGGCVGTPWARVRVVATGSQKRQHGAVWTEGFVPQEEPEFNAL